ncbi:MAG: CoA transferase, partial [Syntrophales bacterium]|nr:CoA transferase [Syntrophales bacterium]
CVEPVLSLGEALNGDNARAREMVVEVPLPDGGTVKQLGFPIRFSATGPEYTAVGVPTGTHTREVLLSLGYTEDQIEEFGKTGLFS